MDAKSNKSSANSAGPVVTATDFPIGPIDRLLIDPYLPDWQSRELERLFRETLGVPKRVAVSKFNVRPKRSVVVSPR
jgi:hypothetical protein